MSAISKILLSTVLCAAAASCGLETSLRQDLNFDEVGSWMGTRTTDQFIVEDTDHRSQWTHEDGTTGFVAAYPLGVGESWSDFRSEYVAIMRQDGFEPSLVDETLPPGFEGFRCFVSIEDADGEPYVALNYMFYDESSTAVHHVYTFVEPAWLEATVHELDNLVSSASWIPAIDPTL